MQSVISTVLQNMGNETTTRPLSAPRVQHNHQVIKNALHVGVWIVEFKKVDGTPAIMECTLDPRLLPAAEAKTSGHAVETAETVRVYALDRAGWRSFRVANVTKFYQKPESL